MVQQPTSKVCLCEGKVRSGIISSGEMEKGTKYKQKCQRCEVGEDETGQREQEVGVDGKARKGGWGIDPSG